MTLTFSPATEFTLVRSRLDELLRFLAERLSASDYGKAEDLIHCMLVGAHSARRHREAANNPSPPEAA